MGDISQRQLEEILEQKLFAGSKKAMKKFKAEQTFIARFIEWANQGLENERMAKFMPRRAK